MRHYLAVLFAVVVLVIPWFVFNFPDETSGLLSKLGPVGDNIAAVIVSHNAKTVAEIQSHYNAPATSRGVTSKVRILLVPGHEPDYGGAEYGSLKERNMTVELAQDLQQILSSNPRYQVFITRNTQSWSQTFSDYFKSNWNDIIAWEQAYRNEIKTLTRVGEFHRVTPTVLHNKAPTDVAMRLFGIDKWVNDNNIDIVIHVHFNDYPGHGTSPGDYSGFAIYVPQNEYDNSSTTRVLADSIFKRLAKYNAVSNLPGESSGIVQDQDLIAIGANNSVNAASMLIEYGYIYEPQFVDPNLHSATMRDLAFQTYLGLQDFFDPHNVVGGEGAFDTLVMPHTWNAPLTASAKSDEIFALQTALLLDGEYPPAHFTLTDCPRTGTIGGCTKSALSAFQKKYNITGEEGTVGPKTVEMLNTMYSRN